MPTLAELPEIVGFFSYSREDDDAYKGRLSALRESIQQELGAQLGRSKTTFRLWQDKAAIAPGKLWESEINTAVTQSAFFIPIVTPRMINSRYCQFEFDAFVAREKVLARSDLIFPILYVPVAALQDEAQWRDHPVLSVIGKRQYVDWQMFRYSDGQLPVQLEAIARFCATIVDALRQPAQAAEERRRQQATPFQSNNKSRQSSTAAGSDPKRPSGSYRTPERPSGSYRTPERPSGSYRRPDSKQAAPESASGASKPAQKDPAGQSGIDSAERKTVFGFPMQTIVPVAGGVALIACVAVALLFLWPGQEAAVQNPVASKISMPNRSAEAQPPRNSDADPPLVLDPSELYGRSGRRTYSGNQ
ncbi:MAG: TIR domain-containing protein [Xanthobacteraceae bacterium]